MDMAVSSGVTNLQKGDKLMSTSLLYHGWGIRGYQELAIRFHDAAIHFSVEQDSDTFCCSHCGSRAVMKAGQAPRRFRSLPIGGKRVWIELGIQRLWCAGCGKTRQAKVAFADEGRGYTHAFERYVLDLSEHMTIKAVAAHLGVVLDLDRGAVVFVGDVKDCHVLIGQSRLARERYAAVTRRQKRDRDQK